MAGLSSEQRNQKMIASRKRYLQCCKPGFLFCLILAKFFIKFSRDKALEQRFSTKGDRIRIKENMTKDNNRLKSIRQVYNKIGFNWI